MRNCDDDLCSYKIPLVQVFHIPACWLLSADSCWTWELVHLCLLASPGPFKHHILGPARSEGAGILLGLGWSIVPFASASHCAELTARPAGAKLSPLPGGSPIRMCRNAGRSHGVRWEHNDHWFTARLPERQSGFAQFKLKSRIALFYSLGYPLREKQEYKYEHLRQLCIHTGWHMEQKVKKH